MKLLLLTLLLLTSCAKQSPTITYHAPPADAEAQKREMRLKAVDMSQPAMVKSGMTAKVEGVNKDILILTSSRLTNAEMIELLKGSVSDFRDIGFKTVVLTDKLGATREINLELFNV